MAKKQNRINERKKKATWKQVMLFFRFFLEA